MGEDNEPSRYTCSAIKFGTTDLISVTETYRYKETPVYTASNGCPVRLALILYPKCMV